MKSEELKNPTLNLKEEYHKETGKIWISDRSKYVQWLESQLLAQQQPAPNAKIAQVWNAITANGCREMDYERFEQAVKELSGIQQAEPVSRIITKAHLIGKKIKLLPEQHEQVQNLAFSLGFKWWNSGQEVIYTSEPWLTFWESMEITWGECKDTPEVLFSDLFPNGNAL